MTSAVRSAISSASVTAPIGGESTTIRPKCCFHRLNKLAETGFSSSSVGLWGGHRAEKQLCI
jgi:hypothetical protein